MTEHMLPEEIAAQGTYALWTWAFCEAIRAAVALGMIGAAFILL
jgi:hypothetical protein